MKHTPKKSYHPAARLKISTALPLLLFALFAASLPAEDLFDFEVDLSRIRPADRPEPAAENRNIFESFDTLPEALRGLEAEGGGFHDLILPQGPYVVAANTPSLPAAYDLIARALETEGLTLFPLLTLLVHADGNVSVGVPVQIEESRPLPLGTDLARLPERHILAVAVEAETSHRNQPAFVDAAARIRREAHRRGLRADTRELYVFPLRKSKVLVGLLVDKP